MEERQLICIGCPMGCPLVVTLDGGKFVSVTGNTCPHGAEYGEKEVTNPTRIVTSSVFVEGAESGAKTVSCKTGTDIPKGKIFDVIKDIKGLTVKAPVHIGDVVKAHVGGTDADMIATKEVL